MKVKYTGIKRPPYPNLILHRSRSKAHKAHRVSAEARNSAFQALKSVVKWLAYSRVEKVSAKELASKTHKKNGGVFKSHRSDSFVFALHALMDEGILSPRKGGWFVIQAPLSWWGPPPRTQWRREDLFLDTDGESESDESEPFFPYQKPEATIEF